LPDIAYDKTDSDAESDDLSDMGGAEGKPPVSLKETEFSVKQFAKRMGQANYSAFNKWKKVLVAVFLKKKHQCIIQWQNRFIQLRDGPLHRVTVVAHFL